MSEKANIKKQNFVLGAMILMISNLAVKVIGAIFKIPLMNIIHAEGMAYFNAAYYVYVMFYQISTAGLPVAISRMVATANAKGDRREANKVFRIALALFFVIGIVGTTVMIALAKSFSRQAQLDNAVYCMIAIAPTVFFICISSAYRGFFQGMQNMIPTAVSQVIEAVGKLSVGIAAALYSTSIGEKIHITAAWVIVGVTIGVALSTVYIMIYKAMYNNAVKETVPSIESTTGTKKTGELLRELIIIAIPIAVSAAIMSLPNNIDTFLKPLLGNCGYSREAATKVYGAYTGMSISLFNMPPTLVYPFGISIIPVLAAAYAAKNMTKAHKTTEAAFRMAAIISLPCSVGMSVLARPIITAVFPGASGEVIIPGELISADVGERTLSIMSIAIFAISLIAITNSVLQAWHREYMAIVATGAGVAAKLVSAYILLPIPGIAERGFAISTAICYFTILAVNTAFIIKYTGYVPKISRVFLKPFIAAAACGIVAAVVYNLASLKAGNLISTAVAICAAGVVYLGGMGIMKGFVEEDILLMPKGEKICRILKKLKVLAS